MQDFDMTTSQVAAMLEHIWVCRDAVTLSTHNSALLHAHVLLGPGLPIDRQDKLRRLLKGCGQ